MTFIYVTHDQEEALTMSDHVAVFNEGRIEQVGTPAEVYERPATEFVAGFVGTSNILERDGRRVCVRPERIAFDRHGGEPATVADVVFVGAFTRYVVETDQRRASSSVVRQADGAAARAAARRFTSPGATRTHSSYPGTANRPTGGRDDEAHVGGARAARGGARVPGRRRQQVDAAARST